eukprot:COSAG05_NODE_1632_length_4371_cov_247.693820_7_plen_94_part_00
MSPMQLRAATQQRNSIITAGVALSVVTGTYYYTMAAMSGRSLDDVDIDKYRAQPSREASGLTNKSSMGGDTLGPLSSSPSIAPGGNPMLEKSS